MVWLSQTQTPLSPLLVILLRVGFPWLLCLCLSCCFGVLFDVIFPLLNRCSLQSPFFRVQCSLRIGIDSVWRWEEGFRLSLPCRLLISLLSCEPPLIFSSSLFTPWFFYTYCPVLSWRRKVVSQNLALGPTMSESPGVFVCINADCCPIPWAVKSISEGGSWKSASLTSSQGNNNWHNVLEHRPWVHSDLDLDPAFAILLALSP